MSSVLQSRESQSAALSSDGGRDCREDVGAWEGVRKSRVLSLDGGQSPVVSGGQWWLWRSLGIQGRRFGKSSKCRHQIQFSSLWTRRPSAGFRLRCTKLGCEPPSRRRPLPVLGLCLLGVRTLKAS